MSYSGSCHCGAVAFSVAGETPTAAMSCNCSHCSRKGFLLSFIPGDTFTLDTGDDALADYQFNKHAITHRFCTTCGCQPFAMGKGADGAETVAVNLRCVSDIGLEALTIQEIDGASF